MIVYKFVEWDVKPAENITYEDFLKLYNKSCSGRYNALRGYLKLGGWMYDFRNDLRKFIVKQNGEWTEYYCHNKTLLRKSLYGRIERIIEI